VKSYSFLADLRRFIFSLICADFICAHLREILFFLADLRGFPLLYINFLRSFICAHLREIFFFRADLRRFIFSQICADFICVHLREIFFFLADLRGFPLLYINFLRSFICAHLREILFFLADLRGYIFLSFRWYSYLEGWNIVTR